MPFYAPYALLYKLYISLFISYLCSNVFAFTTFDLAMSYGILMSVLVSYSETLYQIIAFGKGSALLERSRKR